MLMWKLKNEKSSIKGSLGHTHKKNFYLKNIFKLYRIKIMPKKKENIL